MSFASLSLFFFKRDPSSLHVCVFFLFQARSGCALCASLFVRRPSLPAGNSYIEDEARREKVGVNFHGAPSTWSTWSWSAVGNRTSRAGGLRSTPSEPRMVGIRVAGKRALAPPPGVRVCRERAVK